MLFDIIVMELLGINIILKVLINIHKINFGSIYIHKDSILINDNYGF